LGLENYSNNLQILWRTAAAKRQKEMMAIIANTEITEIVSTEWLDEDEADLCQ